MDFVINRYPVQQGRGIGNIISGIVRNIFPFFSNVAKNSGKLIKNAANSKLGRDIASASVEGISNAVINTLEGKKEDAKKDLVNILNKSKKSTKSAIKRVTKAKLRDLKDDTSSDEEYIKSTKKRKKIKLNTKRTIFDK